MPRFVFSWIIIGFLVGGPSAFGADPVFFQKESVLVEVAPGKDLSATLKIPKTAGGKKLPALLIFGGFQEAARVLELVHPKQPVVLASFDYPFSPPRKFEFPGSLKFLPEAKKMIHETLTGISRLREILVQRPEVDPQRIVLVGASLGAPFAVIGASRDPGFAGVAIIHGFGQVPKTASHQLIKKWKERWGWFAYPAAWSLIWPTWWYIGVEEPEEAAERLKSHQKILMISAEADSFIPATASEALWQSVTKSLASHNRLIMQGDHLQPGSDQLIEKILGHVSEWMAKTGLL